MDHLCPESFGAHDKAFMVPMEGKGSYAAPEVVSDFTCFIERV